MAGEPVEIQVMLEDMSPWVNPRFVILGGAGEEHHTNSKTLLTLNWLYIHDIV